MVGKEGIGSRIFDLVNTCMMLLLCVVMLYPFLNVIAISLSSSEHILRGDITIFPKGFNINGYSYIFKDPFYIRGICTRSSMRQDRHFVCWPLLRSWRIR